MTGTSVTDTTDRALYSVREFCHRNSIGRTTFYALVRSGAVTTVKIGTRTLVPAASERAWHDMLVRSTPGLTRAAAAEAGKQQRTAANTNSR